MAAASGAQAVGFGRVTPTAVLGQPLNVTVPLRLEAGERLFAECVAAEVGSYWIANADGTEATMIIQGAHIPDAGSSWSPNGRQFVYASNAGGQSNLWVINIDGTGDRNLTNGTGETNVQPTWFR